MTGYRYRGNQPGAGGRPVRTPPPTTDGIRAYRRYPWEEWADGTRRTIVQGTHFDVSTESIASTGRGWCQRRGHHWSANRTATSVTFVITRDTPTPPREPGRPKG